MELEHIPSQTARDVSDEKKIGNGNLKNKNLIVF